MIRICARLESVLRLTEEDEEVDGEDVSSSSRTTVAVTCRRVVQELVVNPCKPRSRLSFLYHATSVAQPP
ncbi:hypothetical protein C0Q70_15108 [Pomacea canaliculata]|uniref:Uncharacterized protein n=1 Tax=Pomacea canaliculata TaxID=400727 RepID=A0A2T7NTZ3_POMCA|nr:hypothetical protein C0Q70_15108 [Pomacea canaliculata]